MIWLIENGWYGNGPVGYLLEAPNKAKALKEAESLYRAEALKDNKPDTYYSKLTIEQVTLPYRLE